MFNREHDLDTVCLQPFLPVIVRDKGPWLFDSHIDSLDGALESQDPGCAGHIAAKSLVTWLHGRIQRCVGWKDLMDAVLGEIMLVGDLDEATLLGVRGAWISLVISRVFKRVSRR